MQIVINMIIMCRGLAFSGNMLWGKPWFSLENTHRYPPPPCFRSGQKWAHVSCALWIPEVSIGDAEKMEPVTKIKDIKVSVLG